jgi:Uma2 family endonuclease
MRNRDYHRAEELWTVRPRATLDEKEGLPMAHPAPHRRATYKDVIDAPEHLIAEILDGELVLTPRPVVPHQKASTLLLRRLCGQIEDAVGGPGGWSFVHEVEVHFATNGLEVLVPDIAGWRRARVPEMPETPAIHVAPDWVCETLSPSTERIDRTRKMAIYAREKVGHLWLLDPRRRRLEAYALDGGGWRAVDVPADPARSDFRAAPFDAVALDLSKLWKW